MEEVSELFDDEERTTRVWISARAARTIANMPQIEKVTSRLENCAEHGLHKCKKCLVPEAGSVLRFGIRKPTIRLIGFFEGPADDADFVIMRAYSGKSGDGKRSAKQTAVVDEVVKIRAEGLYRKVSRHVKEV